MTSELENVEYIPLYLAAMRLLEEVNDLLKSHPGTMVKWHLQVKCYHPNDPIAVSMCCVNSRPQSQGETGGGQ